MVSANRTLRSPRQSTCEPRHHGGNPTGGLSFIRQAARLSISVEHGCRAAPIEIGAKGQQRRRPSARRWYRIADDHVCGAFKLVASSIFLESPVAMSGDHLRLLPATVPSGGAHACDAKSAVTHRNGAASQSAESALNKKHVRARSTFQRLFRDQDRIEVRAQRSDAER
jgi:hypothetical protein